ncbi:MAG: SDR family oxidoreductase [Amoebophilaceae bacterium]|nr:SDR family oxidoreductase [Amoebophilaceae bacterium]
MANYLIIAATSDIGTEVARSLYRQGHTIWLTGRHEEKVKPIAASLETAYSVLDATDLEAVDRTFATVCSTLGSIDGVVCCAGSLLLKPAHLTSWDEYIGTMQANLTTSFAVVRSAGQHMHGTGGSVVLISSAAAVHGIVNHEAIAAAKGGVISLARSAAATYASANIRFNVVAPGLVATKMTTKLTQNEVGRKTSETMHALRRLGTAEEIAAAIIFLLDLNNSWITGQVLAVDGGLSTLMPRMKL